MSNQYYIRLGGTVRGPFALTDLREQMDTGRFNLDVYEISEDRKTWRPATDITDALQDTRRARHRPVPGPLKPPVVSVPEPEQPGNAGVPTAVEIGAVPPPAVGRTEWHYTVNGQAAPLPASQVELERLIRSGLVGAEDQVWTRGWNTWMLVRETPEVAHLLERAAVSTGGQTREMSVPAVLAAIFGGVGYVLLLLCTVLLVLRLRRSHLVASENVGVLVMTGIDFVTGVAAIVLGHVAIGTFRRMPGSLKERNVIVFGLSCGYTILIVASLLGIVASLSAASASQPAAG